MVAVLYHPGSGQILQVVQGSELAIAATAALLGLSALEVPEPRNDYDALYRVVDGALELIDHD